MIEVFNEDTTIREIIATYPQTRSVFEKFGIDYCCGGLKDLRTVSEEKKISLETLRAELKDAFQITSSDKQKVKDWSKENLSELADYIENNHHGFMKKQIPELKDLMVKVTRVHGDRHGKIFAYLNLVLDSFWVEIWEHMLKEEHVLFPYIRNLETYSLEKGEKPLPPYGTVANIIRHMERYEHANAGQTLLDIREYTENYLLPSDACYSFKALYDGLQSLEKDLHEHIHLENNILFPGTIELEKNCQII
ncbi:MAG TPA: iron-sulfur cluster repair di-iron protein [Candidatus Eremiobacteraeota bacterium]|nr:MAG: Iron-sulfur cluster repair protein YtfE [bacterium ADurb.Bin363]HPZ08945.1 iron-sulfur cluster repair di-iron protein [Candidatus Eremiobacteraeota bacterium]